MHDRGKKKGEKKSDFKAISGKIFHPQNAVKNGRSENGGASYRKGLFVFIVFCFLFSQSAVSRVN